jgi:hypothetical protein
MTDHDNNGLVATGPSDHGWLGTESKWLEETFSKHWLHLMHIVDADTCGPGLTDTSTIRRAVCQHQCKRCADASETKAYLERLDEAWAYAEIIDLESGCLQLIVHALVRFGVRLNFVHRSQDDRLRWLRQTFPDLMRKDELGEDPAPIRSLHADEPSAAEAAAPIRSMVAAYSAVTVEQEHDVAVLAPAQHDPRPPRRSGLDRLGPILGALALAVGVVLAFAIIMQRYDDRSEASTEHGTIDSVHGGMEQTNTSPVGEWIPLQGIRRSNQLWGVGWLDFVTAQHFPAATELRVQIKGSAKCVAVRLLRKGTPPDADEDIVSIVEVPEDGTIHVTLQSEYNDVVQLSVHGKYPWARYCYPENGAATIVGAAIKSTK